MEADPMKLPAGCSSTVQCSFQCFCGCEGQLLGGSHLDGGARPWVITRLALRCVLDLELPKAGK